MKTQINHHHKTDSKNYYELDSTVLDVLHGYLHVQIGEKDVPVPYYINPKFRKELRALVGKGTPEEIVQETKVWAYSKGINLKETKADELFKFMKHVGIGIDCSGIVYHALANFMYRHRLGNLFRKLKYGNHSLRAVVGRALRPAEGLNANDMTSLQNCSQISLAEVRPGDLIRGVGKQDNSYHVVIITKVEINASTGLPMKLEYIDSHREYGTEEGPGVHEIIITNPHAALHLQHFEITPGTDYNYLKQQLTNDLDNTGIRRLNILEKFYEE